MNLSNLDILSPFEPPHMDSVTGLAIVSNRLISGSKDKNLRLWALDHSINNAKHTLHAFNDYVNTVQSTICLMQAPPDTPSSTLVPRTDKSRSATPRTTASKFWAGFWRTHSP
jgi:hypothetical protein